MTNLLYGLRIYEQVLLLLGVAVAVAALFLIYYASREGKSLKRIFPLFLISIVMIGFPAIEKVELTRDGIIIEKMLTDPSVEFNRSRFIELNRKIAARPNLDPESAVRTTVFQSLLDPLSFQEFTEDNKSNFGKEYFNCIRTIKYNLSNASDPNLGMDFGMYSDPSEPTEAEKFTRLLSDIESVTRGEQRWSNTFFGDLLRTMATEYSDVHQDMQLFIKKFEVLYRRVLKC